ncbi:glycerophosphodiester phosphodiesterase family protein [Flavobacterium sp.]|uniref:glycerophosphodiester phosphodiesterase family protein n=1 Tax=Flavobacterium sp. TaxID=239 RepID=UPI00374CEAA1
MKKLVTLFLFFALNSFSQNFDIQGHRGCRGLLPENSIEAMKKAIEIGVTTLELDVVISADNQVLLSHEPFLSHEICLDTNGNEITEANEKSYNLYKIKYNEIKKCDCGSKIHPRFLTQTKIKTYKPLLSEVIDSVENYIKRKYPSKTIYYNIETKSAKEGDGIFHPKPKEFVDLLLKVLYDRKILNRVFIQSFDVRTLQYLHKIKAKVKTVLLVENTLSVQENLKLLGFKPNVYSPEFILLKKENVQYLHKKKIKVIPWTVNQISDMKQLIDLKVDGLISDYPDRYFELLK